MSDGDFLHWGLLRRMSPEKHLENTVSVWVACETIKTYQIGMT